MDEVLRKNGLPDRRCKRRAKERACAVCGIGFFAIKDSYRRKQKYCSVGCWSVRGLYRTAKCVGCGKVGLGRFGKKYCSRECAFVFSKNAWKGNEAGYSAIHKWIASHYGRPEFCFGCLIKAKRIQWANLDSKYTRDIGDWIPLCVSCHMRFDGTMADVSKRWEKFTGKKASKIVG